jgi:hypothetical protein
MQWNKYANFAATHLDLAPCLYEQLQSIRTDGRSFEDSIVRHLEYIAVRPWESLDLNQKGDWIDKGPAEASVHYTVYAHIEGEEKPCSRAKTSWSSDSFTIEDMIKDFQEWHQIYWAQQPDRPLVFDAVTRTSRLAHKDRNLSSENRRTISFYLFPEGYNA